jgi:hypothetical protein
MKTIDHKHKHNNPSDHQTPRPVRVLDAAALSFVRGGFGFVKTVNKSSP